MSPGGGAMVLTWGCGSGRVRWDQAASDLCCGRAAARALKRNPGQRSPMAGSWRPAGFGLLCPHDLGAGSAMREALGEWCERWLGSAISDVLFETGSLSAVTGVRLADSREVVVKVRRCAPRLNAAYLVQRHVWQCGYPAPEPLVPPVPAGLADCASAEQLVGGGDIGGR